MVRIRLRRNGLKGQASYRIIAADKESPRDGRFLEILGSYNPRTEPFDFKVKEERVYHWMKNGAQPSESVAKLFKSVGLDERFAFDWWVFLFAGLSVLLLSVAAVSWQSWRAATINPVKTLKSE